MGYACCGVMTALMQVLSATAARASPYWSSLNRWVIIPVVSIRRVRRASTARSNENCWAKEPLIVISRRKTS